VSRHRTVLLTVAVCASCWLATPSAWAQMLSPGPLTAAHESLDGDDDCGSCHAAGKRVDDRKCLACHDTLATRIARGAGLHGRQYKDQACEQCHVEHIGKNARLVRWPGGAADKLDHDLTGYKLEGGHAGKPCASCHTQRTRSGRVTFLGASPACISCHKDKDVHRGRLGSDCATCHGVRTWEDFRREAFDHDRTRYPLVARHRSVECKKCHGEPARWTGIPFQACSDCHQDPHAGKFERFACSSCHSERGWTELDGFASKHPGLSLAAGHARVACTACHDAGNLEPPSQGHACVACHPVVHEADLGTNCKSCHASIRWLDLPRSVGLAAHERTVYPLRGKHVDVACDGCHARELPEAQRFRALVYQRCDGCHEDAHRGEFAARQVGECGPCHAVRGFRPTRFSVADHAGTRFALDGRHQATPCGACHTGKRPRLDLRLAGRACADCHADPHGGQFAAEMQQGGCARCHVASDWALPHIDHSTWPLTGAHAKSACARCHGQIDGPGHTPVEQARYRGIARACDGCHADVHAGQFRLSEPVRGCADCHGSDTFALAAGYDHARQTGWALAGKHAQVACASCHASERLRDGQSAVRYRLGYRTCRACHADPHTQGGGSITAGKDCDACHTVASWQLGAQAGGGGFDHARTGFPLLGAHTATPCLACHDGQRRVTRECAGCHRDAHEAQLGSACAECHTAAAWQDTHTLARHQRTRLPLTGKHATVACSACHVTRDERGYSNLPSDCFACHEQDYRREIHPDHDGDPNDVTAKGLSRACGQCHRATGWKPATLDPGTLARRTRRAPAGHDLRFAISFGKHRGASCASCHVAAGDPLALACDGCHAHQAKTLRAQHGGRLPALAASACLRCHPGGTAR